ncbi:hypothetical protein Pmar_PMAR000793 [Perkinsus marinus ATCC 50983]|uniref:Uncharacterized protein n=1 Tax=Perkinsus marinus (strain ATCC 50983 / TXsc) TaxID=423536 RepID=C5KXM4_PERM5|nr:hypothetical protein Pmar_PMAR000793 [Perkinsus marinus ATCC 50983]EER10748.1 hypothetical protein Pmar_PMAR000793 [Perkinsus marinus ATCC 50983]|eukprot:XP_002778953.1 hypothetical protein Pmar_PMAR000793 [Perkinsus marinus ATCC 50983]
MVSDCPRDQWLCSADLVRHVSSFLYQSDVCSLWRTCKLSYEHLHVGSLLWLPNIFLLDGDDEEINERLAEVCPDSVRFIRVPIQSPQSVKALLPFLPHISGLGIEISSAAAAEQLKESLGEFRGRLERIWVEYSVEIDECIDYIGESCKEVYLASTGSSYITVELGTKVEEVVLAGKLSCKTLRCLAALPSNQLIILDLSHCRLPHRMEVSVDDILERHHGSLSYMAFKYFPLPLSRLAGVGARYPRLVCFPKLVRGLDVMQVVLTDLSPRMTFSAPTGSREDYFSRFDHLPLIGWSEFGVFASTLAIFDFCELEATWASLAGEIKGLWAAAAKSVEQLYGDYRKYVPASKLPAASFDLELSSDSGSAEVDDDNSRSSTSSDL